MLLRTTSILLSGALLICGCSPDQAKPASSSGAPAATGSAATGSAATGSAAKADVAPAPVAAASGKTVHIKRTQGECTFDLDAPEELKEAAKDGISVTLESASFFFRGYDGAVLHSKPEHALDMFRKDYKDVYRGTENGIQVAIVTEIVPKKDANDKHAITGMGEEPYASGRSEGCAFTCDGVLAREADVVRFCKSVRIAVKPAAK